MKKALNGLEMFWILYRSFTVWITMLIVWLKVFHKADSARVPARKKNTRSCSLVVLLIFFLLSCQDKRTMSTETEWISKDNAEYEPEREPKPQGSTRDCEVQAFQCGHSIHRPLQGSITPMWCCRPVSVSTKATCPFVCWCLRLISWVWKGVEEVSRKHC